MDPSRGATIGIVQYWFILHLEGHSKVFLCNVVGRWNIDRTAYTSEQKNFKSFSRGGKSFCKRGSEWYFKIIGGRAPPLPPRGHRACFWQIWCGAIRGFVLAPASVRGLCDAACNNAPPVIPVWRKIGHFTKFTKLIFSSAVKLKNNDWFFDGDSWKREMSFLRKWCLKKFGNSNFIAGRESWYLLNAVVFNLFMPGFHLSPWDRPVSHGRNKINNF